MATALPVAEHGAQVEVTTVAVVHRWHHTAGRALRRLRAPVLVAPRIGAAVVLASRRARQSEVPAVAPSLRTVAEVAVDEVMLAAQAVVGAPPKAVDIASLVGAAEVAAGALDHLEPADLHRSVEPTGIDFLERSRLGRRWEELTFRVPVALPDVLGAVSPWVDDETLGVANVRLLRHHDPEPWIILVHGAQQGSDIDLLLLRAFHLHRELGLNVAMPVLPLHGHRRLDPVSVPGLDVVANVAHAVVAVAEIRALRRWIAADSDLPVGLLGVSLGGYLTALTAGIEPGIHVVVAGIPVVNPHRLLARHASRMGGREGRRLASVLRSDAVVALDRFVDPLNFHPDTPVEHRHVLGGSLDRVTTPTRPSNSHTTGASIGCGGIPVATSATCGPGSFRRHRRGPSLPPSSTWPTEAS